MKSFLKYLFLLLLPLTPLTMNAQCTTSNATGCSCKDGSSICDLLPDLKVADDPLLVTGNNGIIEYSQTGNGSNDGRLRVSVSTPNIGYGPLEVHATSIFICGTDTFFSDPGTCPGTGAEPRNMVNQRIFQKNGNTMTYYDRPAGSMTYHASHGHMHVDDWGIYTLRTQTANPDPLSWPVIGDGAKLAFCLMDYGTCTTYTGHCEDNNGTTMTNGDFPNFGLGGGSYNCSANVQGISSGFTDIYYQYLDGMWIDIPPGTCNGNYMVVVELDPHDYFIEEDETNNVMAVPFTLTQQTTGNTPSISINGPTTVCAGDQVVLTANLASTYSWSNGASSQSITVTQPGTYNVTTTSVCGTGSATPVTIVSGGDDPVVGSIPVACPNSGVTLSATSSGNINWYDAMTGGNLLGTGSNYNTAALNANTTFYVESEVINTGSTSNVGPSGHTGSSNYAGTQYNGSVIFNALDNFVLKTVEVETDYAGTRIIELRTSGGTVLNSMSVTLGTGVTTLTLNWNVAPGTNLELGTNTATNQTNFGYDSPDLKRSSSGVSYPYVVNGLCSLNDSPFGTAYYYYFYNWVVEEPSFSCTSVRYPVNVVVSTDIPSITETGGVITSTAASSYQWYLNGAMISGATAQTYTATTSGQYYVEVMNSDNCQVPSNTLAVAIGSCDAPLNLTTTNIQTNSARLSWDAVTGADHYQIRGRVAGGSNWLYVSIPNGSPNHKNVFGLNNYTTYEWEIMAYCDANEVTYSAWSGLVSFTTGCQAPIDNWTNPIAATGATLNWTAVAGASGYEIKGRRVESSNWVTLMVGNLNTSKTVFGLVPNTSYEWTVRTWCDAGGSIISNFTDLDTFTTSSGARLTETADPLDPASTTVDLSVFPNPATSLVSISISNKIFDQTPEISIYNITGKLVTKVELENNVGITSLQVDSWPSGIYHLLLRNGNQSAVEKLVISK